MNLFQYREVSLLLIITFVIVQAVEWLSAILREKIS
jgi:ABC-type phosphate/phosphonate transport system permease subunit